MPGLNKHRLSINSTVTKTSNLATEVAAARSAGFDGVEITADKIRAYLAAGYSERDLRQLLDGMPVDGVGFLIDIERQGAETLALYDEAEALFRLARMVGAPGVELITGPVNVQAVLDFRRGAPPRHYSGLLGRSATEQIRLTARNLAVLADMAAAQGLQLYLEALAWTPIGSITQALHLIDCCARDNLRLVVDYWHCYAAGDTPEVVARIDKRLIYGVHVCDSLALSGDVPDEAVLRNVPTGEGVLDLREWTQAVKATGYQGWWGCELFSKKKQQQNPFDVAREMHQLLTGLVHADA